MKFVIIGPGIMAIPPKNWGGCEIACHYYRKNLEALGHEVEIVNTRIPQQIVAITNAINPDAVHIHYDDHVIIADHLNCKNVIITSHYGYLEQPSKWSPGYKDIFWSFVNSKVNIFCLSDGIKEIYKKAGVDNSRLFVVPNNIECDLFTFSKQCKYPDRSLYLAKIDFRKRQHLYQDISTLYFAGGGHYDKFNASNKRWLGPWSKQKLYKELTEYANLVLLSDGEAHPGVCLEAMASGLGLVLSECATANLDLSKKFIDVIPESEIENIDYVKSVIEKNRKISVSCREEIRKYCEEEFNWNKVMKNQYLSSVYKITGPFHPFIWSDNV